MTMWITVAGWTLVHFVWQGAIIAALFAIGLSLLRAASPNARYVFATIALALMVTSPAITATWVLQAMAASGLGLRASTLASSDLTSAIAGGPHGVVPASFALDARAFFQLTQTFPTIVVLWLSGVGLLLVRLLGGWWRVHRLHRQALCLPASTWQQTVDRLAAQLRIRRAVRARDVLTNDSPSVIGWWRPILILPLSAFAGLTPSQAEAVLTHELAHVRRHDYAVNLLQHVAETVLFYHPGVWWISHRMRVEREWCCDAVAVAYGHDPLDYATALARLEHARAAETTLAIAARRGSLVERIRRILDGPRDASGPLAHAALTAVFVAALVTVVGGGHQWSIRTLRAQGLGDAIATVNGEMVTDADLDHFRPLHGEPADSPLPRVLVELIDERLLVQRGRQLGFVATTSDTQRVLTSLKEQNHIATDAELRAGLAKQRLTITDLQRHIERSRIVFRVGLAESARGLVVTDDEAKLYFDSHLDEFPLQTFDVIKDVLIERLKMLKMGRGIAPESYLQSLRAAATIEWKREDLQHAYAEGLAQRAASNGDGETSSPPSSQTATADWRQYATPHFDIFFTDHLNTEVDRLEREAERAYERVSVDLGHDLTRRRALVLFATRAEAQGVNAVGVPTAAERALVPLDVTETELRAILAHEITHAFEMDILARAAFVSTPAWILEGLSEYEANAWSAGDRAIVRDLVRTNAVPTLTGFVEKSDQAGDRLAYTVGHAAFDFIAARWGVDGIRRLLAALRDGVTERHALYQLAFALDADDIDRAFAAYLHAQFPPT